MAKSVDWVSDAERAGTELKDLIRQAHECIRDLRSVMKEWRELQKEIPKDARTVFDAMVNETVTQGLADYSESLQAAIAKADRAVEARFDRLAAIMLGESDPSQKSLTEYAVEIRSKKMHDPLSDIQPQ